MKSLSFAAVLIAALVPAAASSAQLTPDWVVRRDGVDGFFFGFQVPVYVATDSEGAVYLNNSTLRVRLTDIQTVKYAPDGTEIWSVNYDGPSHNADRGRGVTIDSAGDILVLGQSESLFLVIKYDASDGSIIETMQHDPPSFGAPNAFTTDDAGNIYITGQDRGDEWDFYTVKMDTMGNTLWTARYQGPGPFLFAEDIPIDIALDSNGDVFVTGSSNNVNASADYATIKYRGSDGAQLWLDRYHRSNDTPVDLIIDAQDNVYVTGFTEGQSHVITTIKYRNSDGARLWVALDSPAVQNFATSLALDSKGDVYVAGRADPDSDSSNGNDNAVVIRHRASDGSRLWTTLYGENRIRHFDNALDIIIDSSDNVYISGQTSSFGASADILILRFDALTGQIVDQGTYNVPTRLNSGRALALDPAQNVIVAATTRGGTSGFFDFLTLKYPGDAAGVSAELTGVAVTTGTLLDGGLADLESSDDSYVHTRSGFGNTLVDLHNMEMRISATTTEPSPTTLDLTVESRISEPVGIAQIRLLNHNTQQIDLVGQFALGNTDAIETIFDIDATNYVNAQGDIELSLKHIVFVPFLAFTFESWIDMAEIEIR